MKYGKALEEVWKWREALSKKLEGKNESEQIRSINEDARMLCEKYGIKYKVKRHDPAHA
jgi:hypothetical protein